MELDTPDEGIPLDLMVFFDPLETIWKEEPRGAITWEEWEGWCRERSRSLINGWLDDEEFMDYLCRIFCGVGYFLLHVGNNDEILFYETFSKMEGMMSERLWLRGVREFQGVLNCALETGGERREELYLQYDDFIDSWLTKYRPFVIK